MARAGNNHKGGRPKGSLASHTLAATKGKELLIQMYLERIRPINEALIKKAEEGDIAAIRELHDRVYGRAMQSIELAGKDGNPIEFISGMKITKE